MKGSGRYSKRYCIWWESNIRFRIFTIKNGGTHLWLKRNGIVEDGAQLGCQFASGQSAALEQMLERFGSSHLGTTSASHLVGSTRRNIIQIYPLTVFLGVDSIPNLSEAPPALDSAESCCARSVGSGMDQL